MVTTPHRLPPRKLTVLRNVRMTAGDISPLATYESFFGMEQSAPRTEMHSFGPVGGYGFVSESASVLFLLMPWDAQ